MNRVVAIAAAGTGGHIFPALAVADVMREAGHEVLFFGGDRLEASVVPEAGYRLISVPTKGLSKNVSANLGALRDVGKAFQELSRVMRAEKVEAVLAMGGYITGAAALAAKWRRVPLVLHEQNATAGIANRLAAPLARRILVAFPSATEQLGRGQVVGNPLRRAVLTEVDRLTAIARYGISEGRLVVGVTGGSQGADIINRAIEELIVAWSGEPIAVVHIAGSNLKAVPVSDNPLVEHSVIPYESDMAHFYAAVDLAICRAGALTVSELAATSTAAILIPYSFGSASHQAHNAGVLVDAGAALALDQNHLDRLPKMVADLMTDSDSLSRMSRAAGSLAVRDAAEQVAHVVLEEAARG